jgi:hypothetical protein
MRYLVQEFLAGCWFTIQSFPSRRDAEGYAANVGGNWRIVERDDDLYSMENVMVD